MLGHVLASCDLLGDGRREEGKKGDIRHSHPKKSGGLAGLHFYSWALSPPISDHQVSWARFDIDSPLHSKEITFYFLRPITFACHNHIVQTSLVTVKGIWFYFSGKPNGVQEARLWYCVGFRRRKPTDGAESWGMEQAQPKVGFRSSVLLQSCF